MTSAAGPATALDVMVRQPKTLAPGSTVAEARAAFEDAHVHMLLLADNGVLRGTLLREDLPTDAGESDRAQTYAVLEGRTVTGDVSAEGARRLLLLQGQRRLAVVGASGELLGLLCLKRRLTGFCSDADVLARSCHLGPEDA